MTNVRDVNVGDEVEITVKFKVAKVSAAGTVYSYNSSVMSDGISIGVDTPTDLYTLKIIPKPLAVGDEVHTIYTGTTCHIMAIDGEDAWVKYGDGSHTTFKLDKLKKKDNCNCD